MRYDSIESVNHDPGSPWKRYGKSKLCNMLFARSLHRYISQRDPEARIVSTSLHPGGVKTELDRGAVQSYPWAKAPLNAAMGIFNVSPYKGAITPLYAATAATMEENCAYYVPFAKQITPGPLARDEKLEEELWNLSLNIVRDRFGSLE